MKTLWPHQSETLDALRQSVRQGVNRIVIQSPTGSGKTVLAAQIAEGALRKGKTLAFVVSHLSLIDQVLEEFASEGIRDVGIVQQDHQLTDWSKPIQLCSIQTLRSRGAYPKSAVVIFDECHVLHRFHKQWLRDSNWQRVPFIGLSATPWARGLGNYFDSLLVAATTQELIAKGLLSKFRVFATGHPDLSDVKVTAGDYQEDQLSAAMQKGTLVADIVRTWKEKWGKDKTFIFAVDCAHAKALQARFIEAGIPCGYQDARTSMADRAEIKRQFHNGEIKAIANVGTLTIGVDYDVRCLVLARPTRSEMLYVQIVGRALRTAPGKESAIILDHSDTTSRLGFVTDIHHDHLCNGRVQDRAKHRKPLPRACPKCDCLIPRRDGICVNCGAKIERQVSGIIERDGELFELTNGRRPRSNGRIRKYTMEEKAVFLSGLKQIGLDRGYKSGWALNKYREKFKAWPDWTIKDTIPAEPTMEIKQWVRHTQIKWAMSRKLNEKPGTARY